MLFQLFDLGESEAPPPLLAKHISGRAIGVVLVIDAVLFAAFVVFAMVANYEVRQKPTPRPRPQHSAPYHPESPYRNPY